MKKKKNMISNEYRVKDMSSIDMDEEDKCCESPNIFTTLEGTIVCRNCGSCFGNELVDQDRRSYTMDEIKARRRVEPVWRRFGSRTVISAIKTDCKGKQLSGKKQALFLKLSKIQNSLVSSIERNYWEARPKMQGISDRLGIPSQILETAWKIYIEVARRRLTMGRSINAFVRACLYAAVRIHNFPRLLDEVVETSSLHSVHKSLDLIVRTVLPGMRLKYKIISPRLLIFRFGDDLNLSIATQQEAANLLDRAKGLEKIGKDPKGIAAALLYLCVKRSKSEKKLTQQAIAAACKVTEVTLRTRAKQINICLNWRVSSEGTENEENES